eukprot:m.81573 g.81573  ORF g.81573 m.81573 type:complete len:114 (+) comp25435_c0_seq1:794-1135(+)
MVPLSPLFLRLNVLTRPSLLHVTPCQSHTDFLEPSIHPLFFVQPFMLVEAAKANNAVQSSVLLGEPQLPLAEVASDCSTMHVAIAMISTNATLLRVDLIAVKNAIVCIIKELV